jgi:soluble lytic murein transglycosylase-like protein
MQIKVLQSSAVLRVFALILVCFFGAVAVTAQEKSAGEGARVPIQAATPTVPAQTKETAVAASPAPDYKKTLGDLAALYERDVQKLADQNTKLKALYTEGLISRVDMEKNDQELADARGRVEEARRQIAEANKPAPVLEVAAASKLISNAFWTTGNLNIDNLVRQAGTKYGVDPYLIFCLMHTESRFAANATSPKGAQGLMQLMPGTAARYGVRNPFDASQNIMAGTRYLKDLLVMFNGRVDLALAGYNAGENAVIKHGYTIPPYQETRDYVRMITKRYGMKPAG